MSVSAESNGGRLLAHVLVPVADEADAALTCEMLARYGPDRVTAAYVVEKGEGVPDKTPVAQSETAAEAAFEAVRAVFPDAETDTRYDRDVVEAIMAAARETDASAIAFHPRGGSRLTQFLAGDRTIRLVTEADRPVLALQEGSDAGDD